jgi:hypothetical protein
MFDGDPGEELMTTSLLNLTPYLAPGNVGKTADRTSLDGSAVPFGFDDGIPNWPAGIKPTIVDSKIFGHPVLQHNIPSNNGSTKTRCEVWANTPGLITPHTVDQSAFWKDKAVLRRGDTVSIDFEVYTDLAGWGARDDYGQIILQLQGQRSGPKPWTAGPVEIQIRHGQWRIGGGEGVWQYVSYPFVDKRRTIIELSLYVAGPGSGWYAFNIKPSMTAEALVGPVYPKLGTIYDDQEFLIPRPALYGGNIPDRRYANFGSWKVEKL